MRLRVGHAMQYLLQHFTCQFGYRSRHGDDWFQITRSEHR